MAEYQEIIITWSRREKIRTASDLQKIDEDRHNIFYQIYGDHHIYGRDILLYIGISTFADNRFKTHLNGVFSFVNNLMVSIGKCETTIENLEIPESILIANHKPSFNKEFIHDLPAKAKESKIIIINNGNNEMLKTCCTNFWWV